MLVEEIEAIGLEPLQRRVGYLSDVGRPAVYSRLLAVLDLESELGRTHDLIANWAECFTNDFFVRERSVHFGRIEEGDASVNRRTDDRHTLLAIRWRPVTGADAHAAESQR